ncbi:MAG TPA: transcriptional regulator [Cyanobacteria bacterium UBA8803]|nr:transcriptional regulator [Cyanobacteria bacterium UBA9273]HBL61600.1 transcriptional regulator [Cyanobacteria bacterium UBA8803]
MEGGDVQRIPLQLSQGCLVASIQIELTEEVIYQFRKDLLERLHTTRARGVIIDLSGVEIMDLEDFEAFQRILSMATIMGVETILTGFQPGVVSALVDLNAEIDSINAALDLDDALQLMNTLRPLKHDIDLLPEKSSQAEINDLNELDESTEPDLDFSQE